MRGPRKRGPLLGPHYCCEGTRGFGEQGTERAGGGLFARSGCSQSIRMMQSQFGALIRAAGWNTLKAEHILRRARQLPHAFRTEDIHMHTHLFPFGVVPRTLGLLLSFACASSAPEAPDSSGLPIALKSPCTSPSATPGGDIIASSPSPPEVLPGPLPTAWLGPSWLLGSRPELLVSSTPASSSTLTQTALAPKLVGALPLEDPPSASSPTTAFVVLARAVGGGARRLGLPDFISPVESSALSMGGSGRQVPRGWYIERRCTKREKGS